MITYTIVGASQTSAGAAPVATINGVFISSISVQWPDVSLNDGYVMEAYSDENYTSLTASSATAVADLTSLTFNAGALLPNTTYWIKGRRVSITARPAYGFTTPISTSTLTDYVRPTAQVYRVFVSKHRGQLDAARFMLRVTGSRRTATATYHDVGRLKRSPRA